MSYYNRGEYTVNAKSITTLNLPDTANYFFIINRGDTPLYFSATRTPSREIFDMKIPPSGAKMHVEPFPKFQVYIFNDGAQACDFSLIYFNAEFEPLVMALSSLETMGGGGSPEQSKDVVIDGFNSPLPSGSNTIGKVQLDGTKTDLINTNLTAIKTAIEGIEIGSSYDWSAIDWKTIEFEITRIKNHLNNINPQSATTASNTGDIKTLLTEIKTAIDNIEITGGSGVDSGVTEQHKIIKYCPAEMICKFNYTADFEDDKFFSKIDYVTNDDDKNKLMIVLYSVTGADIIHLDSHETLENIDLKGCFVTGITIISSNHFITSTEELTELVPSTMTCRFCLTCEGQTHTSY